MRRVHLALAIIWILMVVPTLVWWRDSVLWISFMSLYAIVCAHLAAYQGARAERAAKDS